MSIQDLEEHGVLLPEEEWDTRSLETTVSEGPLMAALAGAILSLIGIYLGGGRLWTWVSAGGFLLSLATITWLCDRAVARQRRRADSGS